MLMGSQRNNLTAGSTDWPNFSREESDNMHSSYEPVVFLQVAQCSRKNLALPIIICVIQQSYLTSR